jgi:hypothetical protein
VLQVVVCGGLETISHYPIDYRTKKEIQEAVETNRQWERDHPRGR